MGEAGAHVCTPVVLSDYKDGGWFLGLAKVDFQWIGDGIELFEGSKLIEEGIWW